MGLRADDAGFNIRSLQRAGYDDVLAIEFEGMEPCEEAIALGLENLKRVI